jgi:hypothetical protein
MLYVTGYITLENILKALYTKGILLFDLSEDWFA